MKSPTSLPGHYVCLDVFSGDCVSIACLLSRLKAALFSIWQEASILHTLEHKHTEIVHIFLSRATNTKIDAQVLCNNYIHTDCLSPYTSRLATVSLAPVTPCSLTQMCYNTHLSCIKMSSNN